MNENAKKVRAAYMRGYYKKNKAKFKKYKENYWTRKAEQEEAAAAQQEDKESEHGKRD